MKMRAVTDEDVDVYMTRKLQEKQRQRTHRVKLVENVSVVAILVQTVVLEALGIVVLVKVIRR